MYIGQATVELTKFDEVIGLDPSEAMVAKARGLLSKSSPHPHKLTYSKSKAEELDHLETESVDMVIAGKKTNTLDRVISLTYFYPDLIQRKQLIGLITKSYGPNLPGFSERKLLWRSG